MVSSSISFSFCGNFFATWQHKINKLNFFLKEKEKREGSKAGLELMHGTDLFGKKRLQIRHIFKEKEFEITKSKISINFFFKENH
jgi:hypothetical protein